MKKTYISLIILLSSLLSSATELNINFSGINENGTTAIIDSILVENVSQKTFIKIPKGNSLKLFNVITDIENTNNSEKIQIHYNSDKIELKYLSEKQETIIINIYNINGKKIIDLKLKLEIGYNLFDLSLLKGIYILNIIGNNYSYSEKIISKTNNQKNTNITFINNTTNKNIIYKAKNNIISMQYNIGDNLLYRVFSGDNKTIVSDLPTDNKTIDVKFIVCIDNDGNNYTTINIGGKIWMAENLRTTSYTTNLYDYRLTYVYNKNDWDKQTDGAYCFLNNDIKNMKYGVLYNGYAMFNAKLAPIGWKIPNVDDYNKLFATNNIFVSNGIYGSTGNQHSDILMVPDNWQFSDILAKSTAINSVGFSAQPIGKVMGNGIFFGEKTECVLPTTTRTNSNMDVFILSYTAGGVRHSLNTDYYKTGFFIRCIKN